MSTFLCGWVGRVNWVAQERKRHESTKEAADAFSANWISCRASCDRNTNAVAGAIYYLAGRRATDRYLGLLGGLRCRARADLRRRERNSKPPADAGRRCSQDLCLRHELRRSRSNNEPGEECCLDALLRRLP